MMRVGQDIEAQQNRPNRIRWLAADGTRPLSEQIAEGVLRGPEPGYDIVMANWLFDHATSLADLEAMWRNVAANLKPGGKFLGVRATNIRAPYMSVGKYGVTFTEVEEIPGPGLKYVCGCLTQPPFAFGATSMESTYSLADDIPRGLGLVDFAVIPAAETELVRNDTEFWADFVNDPNLAVVVAKKA
ncbi:hypothetical protein B0H63DRAFT_459621 [Podospora didyma]|uniref:Uncharacterized protein n=1 Tax=Podospora didyma TaxID=330526 RepID=A0AAE0P5Z1_9PEZI|nr:hypothetical protein B0H63DRAFT_459621 [Podospora didyma]